MELAQNCLDKGWNNFHTNLPLFFGLEKRKIYACDTILKRAKLQRGERLYLKNDLLAVHWFDK